MPYLGIFENESTMHMVREQFYKYLYLLVVACYAIVLSRFGFENWDSGFVTAFNWRVLQGELPYSDFIYIRPPLSAFLHAAYIYLLPETAQYFMVRAISYLMFGLQVWFAVAGVDRLYDLKSMGIQKWGLMTVCFMVSRHNFLPGPWFTTDGIFFAAASFYVMSGITHKVNLGLVTAAVLCLASSLCKQSFYFIPIIFSVWVLISFGIKKAALFVSTMALLLLMLITWLNSYTSLENAIDQVVGTGNGSDLIQVGFRIYIQAYHNRYILAAILLLPLLLIKFQNAKSSFKQYLGYLSWTIFSSALVYMWIDFKQSTVILFNAVAVAFLYRCGSSLFLWRQYFPLMVLMVISWCSGLSLGYPYPVLFATGMILSGAVLRIHSKKLRMQTYTLPLASGIVCIWALLLNHMPYREQSIMALTYSLEAVSPKLKYISSGRPTLEKNLELRDFTATCPGRYAVIPGSPATYYLFGHQNPLPADWVTNFEIKNTHAAILKLIAHKDINILIERSFIDGEKLLENPPRSEQEAFSSVALYIYENCSPARSGKHFLVYDPKELAKIAD